MKIVLINPNLGIWIKARTVPLGLAYIGSVLEKAGHTVEIIDRNVYPNKKIPSDASLVGSTATTPVVFYAWEVLKEAKEQGCKTVIGGPHATCLPEESAALPYIDYVVRGEGEETIVELCKAISENREPENVFGVTYKNEKGEIVNNKPRLFIKNLDSIPFPAYHLFPDLHHYTNPQPLLGTRTPAVNLVTSRGCAFNCNFCYKGTFGRTWRHRSPENVIEEWEMLVKKYKVKEIGIQDDIFNTNIERCIKILDKIIEKNLVVPWTTPNGIRADLVNDELFEKMRKSGCYRVAFGIESGVQDVLDKSIHKNIKLSDIEKAVKLARKHNIKTLGFFVLGNLNETEEQMRQTVEFAIKLGLDYAQFTTATPFPGTELYSIIKEKGELLINDWRAYSQFDNKPYFEYEGIKLELANEIVKMAYRKFYIRPIIMWRFLKDLNTWRNLSNVISGGVHFAIKGK
jgi:radical SAM superfamily enzyme YgiQ (UPF0313 family)